MSASAELPRVAAVASGAAAVVEGAGPLVRAGFGEGDGVGDATMG